MSAPNIPPRFPPQLELPAGLAISLMEAAIKTIRAGLAEERRRRRPRRGETLKPGPQTPLWNELARAVRAELAGHGAQARLGRVLLLPRQRVHEMLTSSRHLPDAERTLMLLVWLSVRSRGGDLG